MVSYLQSHTLLLSTLPSVGIQTVWNDDARMHALSNYALPPSTGPAPAGGTTSQLPSHQQASSVEPTTWRQTAAPADRNSPRLASRAGTGHDATRGLVTASTKCRRDGYFCARPLAELVESAVRRPVEVAHCATDRSTEVTSQGGRNQTQKTYCGPAQLDPPEIPAGQSALSPQSSRESCPGRNRLKPSVRNSAVVAPGYTRVARLRRKS